MSRTLAADFNSPLLLRLRHSYIVCESTAFSRAMMEIGLRPGDGPGVKVS